jgi:hypothetical protein
MRNYSFLLDAAVAITAIAVAWPASSDDRPAWIIEREQMWEKVEAACGSNIPSDDLEEALRICPTRNAARARAAEAAHAVDRKPGTIRRGDRKEYVELQWGRPDRIETMMSQCGLTEWWFYPADTVMLHNGRVDTIHQTK